MSGIDNERISEPGNPPSPRTLIMNKRIGQLELAKQRVEEDYQRLIPKIQRIPAILRENAEFAKYCTPKMISFGPIHHGEKNLEQGEHFKLLWTYKHIEEYSKQTNQATDQVAQSLLQTVRDKLGELKKLFIEDAIGETKDEDFAWMLFVDGCSLLHFLEKIDKDHPEALKIKLDQMMYIRRDIFMLENQLPTRLLELLNMKRYDLAYLMTNFHTLGVLKQWTGPIPKEEADLEQSEEVKVIIQKRSKPIHILDHICSFFLAGADLDTHEDHVKYQRESMPVAQSYKNMRDLRAVGIRVKVKLSKIAGSISNDVSFKSMLLCGELRLPQLEFDDASSFTYRNLIAYEMCPDFHNNLECCSFFGFMDSLIEGGEDVKELRLAGVIQNKLGSDDELAKLFIEVSRDLPAKVFNNTMTSDAMANNYTKVTDQIEKHYKDKWRTYLPLLANTYFRAPWSVFTFLHAIVAALILTSIQTWYTVYPKKP